jgi:hypothetical protein
MTRSRQESAVTVVVFTVLAAGAVLMGWATGAVGLLGLAVFVGAGLVVIRDSNLRGRSGLRWLAAYVIAFPVAVPLFLFFAIKDRVRGRQGIEASWQPVGRVCLLGGILLAGVAAVIAMTPVHGGSVVLPPGPVGVYPGVAGGVVNSDCSTPLGVALGDVPFQGLAQDGLSPEQAAVVSAATQECTQTAGRRMLASELCLLGAFGLTLVVATIRPHEQYLPPVQRKTLETV